MKTTVTGTLCVVKVIELIDRKLSKAEVTPFTSSEPNNIEHSHCEEYIYTNGSIQISLGSKYARSCIQYAKQIISTRTQ